MRHTRITSLFLFFAVIHSVLLFAEDFNYLPPGDLIPGTGTGVNDCTTHVPSPLLYPIRQYPSFPKSQVHNDPQGLCLSASKYDHPWRDNFCECRSREASDTPECPAQGSNCTSGEDGHHQGVDILPPTCANNSTYEVVAVASGNLQRVNSYVVDLTPDNAPGITYRYLHMSNVIADQHVERGAVIGNVSNVFTAPTTIHLHFEILVNGRHVSPYMTLLDAYRQTIGRIAPGARVRATKALTVHGSAAGSTITSKAAGATGVVVGNTQQANYEGNCWIWKQIQWDDGLVGYSQDNYLAVVAPTSLVQVNHAGSLMPAGSSSNASVVTLGGHVTSPTGKDVALEVELRRLDEFGGSFTGSKTHEAALRPSGTTTSLCVSGLINGTYHWRARVRDSNGSFTPWQSFGGNSDSAGDFSVQETVCGVCAPWPSEPDNPMLAAGACTPTAQAPAVTTTDATGITQASASLNMSVDPNGASTNVYFDYGPTTSMSLVTSSKNVGAGNASIPASITVTGLACNTKYYYRARASNSAGAATPPGGMLSFTTSSCGGGSQALQLVADPSFEAGPNGWWVASPAFYIDGRPSFTNPRTGNNYAFLSNPDGSRGNNLTGGMISPSVTIPSNATDLDLRFWYSITSDEATSSPALDKLEVFLVRPGNQLTLITTLSNVNENGTTYSLRSEDISSSFYGDTVQIFFRGTTNGSLPTVFRIDDVTLEVARPSGGPPTVSTSPADQVTAVSARLGMTVNPNGANTEVWFNLDPNDSTPSTDTERFSVGAGTQNQAVSWTAYGLTCGTTYYFRAHAGNSFDSSESGSILSFTTSACSGGAPRADTEAATNITRDAATLNARPDANGLATEAWFEWGETSSLGLQTPRQPIGSAVGRVNYSYRLTGLSCGRTYYFENHAANAADEDDGATLSFTTASCDLPSPSSELLLFTSRQACSGTAPAVLLGWTMPQGADPLVTIRRADGQYAATVNTAVKGPVHEIDSGLAFGNVYRFTVEAQVGGATLVSNRARHPHSV